MQVGTSSSGVLRVFRSFRGSEVIKNKKGQFVVEQLRNGGICFGFEIDYNANKLRFTAAITLEQDKFDLETGKQELIKRIEASIADRNQSKIYEIPLNGDPLMDQVYTALEEMYLTGTFKKGNFPFLYTLYKRLELLSSKNQSAEDFYAQIQAGDC